MDRIVIVETLSPSFITALDTINVKYRQRIRALVYSTNTRSFIVYIINLRGFELKSVVINTCPDLKLSGCYSCMNLIGFKIYRESPRFNIKPVSHYQGSFP